MPYLFNKKIGYDFKPGDLVSYADKEYDFGYGIVVGTEIEHSARGYPHIMVRVWFARLEEEATLDEYKLVLIQRAKK